ncbi:endothelial PAS domain-containing protein 1 [Antennarius striatus]|uniref:endothelial PAS domain-containing protein 1 n=1 Tax=Antennarius striatus TaxID=241820 RepID=UPI0035AE77C7
MTADKERRRAISREAARRRRRVESDVFVDLSRLLPLHPGVGTHLDRPSVIRLTLSYLRTRTLLKGAHPFGNVGMKTEGCHSINQDKKMGDGEEQLGCDGKRHQEGSKVSEETNMYLMTLEGFLMVLSADGDVVFLSDNIRKYMGWTQTELMGHNIFELAHPCDHEEVRSNLRLPADEGRCGAKRDFIMRVKSALTSRGRSPNLRSSTWKVLHCQGWGRACPAWSAASCLLLTCQPLPLSHTLLSGQTFSSQHSMDMRLTHCDQRVTLLLGYRPEELLGRSIYDLCHTLDTHRLTKHHLNLCLKSQSVSGPYRMLVKGGGYVWAESHGAVIPRNTPSRSRPGVERPLCILCVTYILSGVEEPYLQLSLDQMLNGYPR